METKHETPKKRKNEDFGYVQLLSPKRVSGRGYPWYEFYLQTSPTVSKRIAGFDMGKYNKVSKMQQNKSPIKILYGTGEDAVINKQTNIREVETYDVSFPYVQMENESCASS